MKLSFFLPILKWGPDPNAEHGASIGSQLYTDLRDLYGLEEGAVGHFEVSGEFPSETTFKAEKDNAE